MAEAAAGWGRTLNPGARRGWAIVLAAVLVALVLLSLWAAPRLLWLYNLERAGRLLDQTLLWPEPRRVDSLPTGSGPALEAARAHLAAAQRWQPTAAESYRLAARTYLAEERWRQAAEAAEQAARLAPRNQLLGWEAGLAYEQLARVVEAAPTQPLAGGLPMDIQAPAIPIDTPFCSAGDEARLCYAGTADFALPDAGDPTGTPIARPSILVHAPATARLSFTVPSAAPWLLLATALAPEAAAWAGDGGRLSLWVEADGARTLLYEREGTRDALAAGWEPVRVDLTPWEGRVVTVALESGAGAAGDNVGDWFLWGELRLAGAETAAGWAMDPRARNAALWLEHGFDGNTLVHRGLFDRTRGRFAEALLWYARAERLGTGVASVRAFTEYQLADKEGDSTGALEALERAIAANEDWHSEEVRYQAWHRWAISLSHGRDYAAAEEALRQVIDFYSPEHSTDALLSEQYRRLGLSLANQERWEEAVEALDQARVLNPSSVWAEIHYGKILYRLDPDRAAEAQAAFERAVTLAPEDSAIWINLIESWDQAGEDEYKRRICLLAEGAGQAEAVAPFCGDGCYDAATCRETADALYRKRAYTEAVAMYRRAAEQGADVGSSEALASYLEARVVGDDARAAQALAVAVERDSGWMDEATRFRGWHWWGQYLMESERYPEAETVLQRAITLAPNDPISTNLLSESYRFYGLTLAQQGRLEEAIPLLEQAVALYHENVWAHIHYGKALAESDPAMAARAQEEFLVALNLEPEQAGLWSTVISFWDVQNQPALAADICTEAGRLDVVLDGLCPRP